MTLALGPQLTVNDMLSYTPIAVSLGRHGLGVIHMTSITGVVAIELRVL